MTIPCSPPCTRWVISGVCASLVIAGCVTPQADVTGPAITAQDVQDLRTETTGVKQAAIEARQEQGDGGTINEPWTARLLVVVLGAMGLALVAVIGIGGLYLLKYRLTPVRRAFDWVQGKDACSQAAPDSPPGGG